MISFHGFHTPSSIYDMAARAVREAEQARQAREVFEQEVLGPVGVEGGAPQVPAPPQDKGTKTKPPPQDRGIKTKPKALPAPRRCTRSSPDHVTTRSRKMTNKRKRSEWD